MYLLILVVLLAISPVSYRSSFCLEFFFLKILVDFEPVLHAVVMASTKVQSVLLKKKKKVNSLLTL